MNRAEQVDRDGYAIVPAVVDELVLRDLLEQLGGSDLPSSRAGVRHMMKDPRVAQIAAREEMIGIAREIVGAQAWPFLATLFNKSPSSNWLLAWHQDTALPLRERRELPRWGPWSVKEGMNYAHAPREAFERVVALRLHLDDSRKQWSVARAARNAPERSADRRGGASLDGEDQWRGVFRGPRRGRYHETARDTRVVESYKRTASTVHIEYASVA